MPLRGGGQYGSMYRGWQPATNPFTTSLTPGMTIVPPYTWTFDPGVATQEGFFFADGVKLDDLVQAGPYTYVLEPGVLANGAHNLGHAWILQGDGTLTHHTPPSSYAVTVANPGGVSGPVNFPSYRMSIPPNQSPFGNPGDAIGYVNLGSSGSNDQVTGQNLRVIDTYSAIDFWFTIQIRVPNEWPWSSAQTPGGSFFNFWNPHLIGLDPMWANQAWFNVSPLILQFNQGFWTWPAGKASLNFMLEQWDGITHFPVTGHSNDSQVPHVADIALGSVHDIVVHLRAGSYSLSSFSRIQNPRPVALQATGLLQTWVDDDIFNAPSSPTFDSDAFAVAAGQVLDGVSHISTDRVCKRPSDGTFWAQRYWGFYEQGYGDTWLSPLSTAHFDLRIMSIGQTLAEAFSETFTSADLVDNSDYSGSGTNSGNASFAATPDTFPAMRVPTSIA